MLDKRIATNGHIYAKLSSLEQWEKNPRDIYEKDFLHLKILIATLGLFKPLFVTADGKMVGGNMRLPAIKDLNTNVLEWDDDKGQHHTMDMRGKFEEVPITELDFATSDTGKVHAMLDGVMQEKEFESIEQALIEYSSADNMSAGFYDQQKAAELFLPHQDKIDMDVLSLNLAPAVPMKTFVDQYQPPTDPPGLDKKKGKQKVIVIEAKYTPEQFAQIEPKLEKVKHGLGLENITDLFTTLIEEESDRLDVPDNKQS